jgi:hypothetical protein
VAAQFELPRIHRALRGFKESFDAINTRLTLHREPIDDGMIDNMLAAYAFLNGLMRADVDLFSAAGLHSLLELNHIVLCGTDPAVRREYYRHVLETRTRFHQNIRHVRRWVERRRHAADPVGLASGFYLRSLSQPQLFIEGNHRTENIVLNYLLASRNHPPLVVTRDNAYEYLEVSGRIKFTDRNSLWAGRWMLAVCRREFDAVVRRYASPDFITEKE